ncbi:MAG TPA: peptidase M14, partial [Bryobacteraceae bacterium]|nr:peptidase M14 [Bryobacteraceae bacterium]
MLRILACTAALALVSVAAAEPVPEFWPGVSYDPSIPTLRKVLGYETGERITSHEGILRYIDALGAAAPSRLKVFEYGQTWEGRKLVYIALGSESNIRRLSEIRVSMKKLADPRITPEAEFKRLSASLPAVLWLG